MICRPPPTAIGVVLALVLALAALPARAAQVLWFVAGHVLAVEPDFGGSNPTKIAQLAALGVVPNAQVTGYYSIEVPSVDQQPGDPTTGEYRSAVKDVELEIATVRVEYQRALTNPSNTTVLVTTAASPVGTSLLLSGPGRDDPPLAASHVLAILDQYGGALSFPTDALPASPPPAGTAATVEFLVVSENEFVIRMALDYLSATAPAAVPALHSGAAFALAALLLAAGALGAAQTGRMPRFFGGSGSSGRAR